MNDKVKVAKIVVDNKQILYEVSNPTLMMRAQSLFTKEPDTIHWLNQLPAEDTFIDIGANVGMYTIYAAAVRGMNVVAFEPESQNYAVLNRNIYMNQLKNVQAYLLGISDTSGFSELYLSAFNAGGSCHTVGASVNHRLERRESPYVQHTYAMTLDDYFSGYYPDSFHIKIDVDGIEHLVLDGMSETLQNCQSVLVEVNTALREHMDWVDELKSMGFELSGLQTKAAIRKKGPFTGVGNFIFYKPDSGITFSDLVMPDNAWNIEDNDESFDTVKQQVMSSLSFDGGDVDPYPHAYINGLFTDEFYQDIMKCKPDLSEMTKISETPRTPGAYPERHIMEIMNDDAIFRLHPRKRRVMLKLRALLSDEDVIKQLLTSLGVSDDYERTMDILYMRDAKGYSIAPHTDVSSRLAVVMIYLPIDSDHAHLGTKVYKHKDGAVSSGNKHFSKELDNFEVVAGVDYMPNTALAFKRCDNSYHGVEEIQEDYVRDTICMIVRKVS